MIGFKKSCIALLMVIMGVAFMLPSFILIASAEDSGAGANPKCELSSETGLSGFVTDANSLVRSRSGRSGSLFSYSGKTITINMVWYSDLDMKEKQDAMSAALESINKSALIQRDKTKLYNFVCDLDKSTSALVRQLSEDVDADFARGYSWFKPFSGGVSTVLGFLTLVIFVMLTLTIVLDIAYLSIPVFRIAIDSWFSKGDTKPTLVSHEAYSAIQACEADTKTAKSAMGIYARSKMMQFVIVGICLLYLVGGEIFQLIARFIDAFSGIFD